MNENAIRTLLTLLPKRSLSDLAFWASNKQVPTPVLRSAIWSYAKTLGVNLNEMDRPLKDFRTFDEFFTRKLAPGARVIDTNPRTIISPCDGTWAIGGNAESMELTQIKGKTYQLAEFLDSESWAECFSDALYATIYLSPRDYHRVHFPVSGEVTDCHHIPGEVWPVNPPGVKSIDQIFSRNERLIVYLDTPFGPVAVAMVAATCVSAITTSFDPDHASFDHPETVRLAYPESIAVKKGDELGVFHVGSTVIMLFPRDAADWLDMTPGRTVLMGQRIGSWRNA
jgi:phosphatidylserine decarboxylase